MIPLRLAQPEEALEIAALRTRVAAALTLRHGTGHWSSAVSEKGVLYGMRMSKVYVAREGGRLAATLRLATKKPWAIDTSYFTPGGKALYLVDMAVEPELQRTGIGRQCLADLTQIGREWPAGAIRLDAYDAEAGAGEFYRKCGYREVGRVTYKSVPLIYYEMLLG